MQIALIFNLFFLCTLLVIRAKTQFLCCNTAHSKYFLEKTSQYFRKALDYVCTKVWEKNLLCKYWHCDILNTFQVFFKIVKVLQLIELQRKSSRVLRNDVDYDTKFNQDTVDKGFKTSETSIKAQVVCNKHQKLIKTQI